jgi:hypothetical protein
MEVEDYFIGRLRESEIQPDNLMTLLGKHMKGYVPDVH